MTRRPAAFITGASRGIGRGIALELAKSGFDIAGNATSYDPKNTDKGLAEVERRVKELGAAFLPLPCDISLLEEHHALLDKALDTFGRIEVLVNNAGVAPAKRLDILDTTPELFDRIFSVNARAAFFLSQRFARRMIRDFADEPDARPCIIFITSVSVYMSTTNRADYCLSKAALSHAARIFAHRLAEHKISVFEVRPGVTRTDMTLPVEKMYDQRIREGLIPEGRWGLPEDVGRAVSALARGEFTYATGTIVEIGGGLHIHRL